MALHGKLLRFTQLQVALTCSAHPALHLASTAAGYTANVDCNVSAEMRVKLAWALHTYTQSHTSTYTMIVRNPV